MIIRRYYPRGFKGKTYSDAYIEELFSKGVDVDLVDTAKIEIVLNYYEQVDSWQRCLDMVLSNTRWVLDNLEGLPEFKVGWQHYSRGKRRKPKVL